MPRVLKFALAVVLAVTAWFVVATLGNFVLRAAIPGYRATEATLAFTLAGQLGRLLLGVISTAAAAVVAQLVVRRSVAVSVAAGLALLVLFIPVHLSLWTKFPVWYHLFFLASLPIVALAVGRLTAAAQEPA